MWKNTFCDHIRFTGLWMTFLPLLKFICNFSFLQRVCVYVKWNALTMLIFCSTLRVSYSSQNFLYLLLNFYFPNKQFFLILQIILALSCILASLPCTHPSSHWLSAMELTSSAPGSPAVLVVTDKLWGHFREDPACCAHWRPLTCTSTSDPKNCFFLSAVYNQPDFPAEARQAPAMTKEPLAVDSS